MHYAFQECLLPLFLSEKILFKISSEYENYVEKNLVEAIAVYSVIRIRT